MKRSTIVLLTLWALALPCAAHAQVGRIYIGAAKFQSAISSSCTPNFHAGTNASWAAMDCSNSGSPAFDVPFLVPEDFTYTSNFTVRVLWVTDSADTSSVVRWTVTNAVMDPNTNVNTFAFGNTENTTSVPSNGAYTTTFGSANTKKLWSPFDAANCSSTCLSNVAYLHIVRDNSVGSNLGATAYAKAVIVIY